MRKGKGSMEFLQKTLDVLLQEQVSKENILVKVIQKQLEKSGITLTKTQLKDIKRKLKRGSLKNLTFSIRDSQVPVRLRSEEKGREKSLNLSDSENVITEILDEFNQLIADMIPGMVSDISPIMLRGLKRTAAQMLRERRAERKAFEANLAHHWGKALDSLQMLIVFVLEAGDDFNREFRHAASREQDYVFNVLARLHARACQVASEIITLLRAGYADGAHARWRCLHEIAVVALFIVDHGNDVAERYLLHEGIESYKAANQYQEHFEALGYVSLTKAELEKFEKRRNALITHFGKNYGGDYGWAADVLKISRPTFSDIEKQVGLDHFRPYYKLASHNVHANPKGLFFKLGLYPKKLTLLLAGPSNIGLTDPGHSTALSLSHVLVAFLMTRPNFDRLVICDLIHNLGGEIGQAFWAAEESVRRRTLKISKSRKRERREK